MSFALENITPVIGAEAHGIDLSRLDEEMSDWLRIALADRKVLVFRNQTLGREAHKRAARIFGTGVLHVHHLVRGRFDDDEVVPVHHDAQSTFNIGEGWHSDASCDPDPIAASLLYMRHMPESGGGDTVFSDMHECWRRLSDPVKSLVSELTARHDGGKGYGEDYGIAADITGHAYNQTDHPIVIDHPVTGAKTLFVNTGFTTRINHLSAHESRSILDMVFRHIEQTTTAQIRVRWAPDTLVMWDNVATQHQGVWDYFPETRLAERVSVIGPKLSA